MLGTKKKKELFQSTQGLKLIKLIIESYFSLKHLKVTSSYIVI